MEENCAYWYASSYKVKLWVSTERHAPAALGLSTYLWLLNSASSHFLFFFLNNTRGKSLCLLFLAVSKQPLFLAIASIFRLFLLTLQNSCF